MEERKTVVKEYIHKLFHQMYNTDVPPSLLEQYALPIVSGQAQIDDAKAHIAAIGEGPLRAYLSQAGFPFGITEHSTHSKSQLIPPITEHQTSTLSVSPTGGEASQLDQTQVKEYVDKLYLTFTGRLGDPASTNYVVRSIIDKSFSLNQAELHVRFSKEAKAYGAKKKHDDEDKKREKLRSYIAELYRVYANYPTTNPFTPEMEEFFNHLLNNTMSLQDVEDEVRMRALMTIKPPSHAPVGKR
eukprot:TRINITY_DN5065_c0_g1_i1.p1 TRINITY_DN5065_c0_g1~~TRINITY_DN5065_c0_g1_i1.p1  ORF type:complete len:243 (-),score=46.20 TRINITY_DN5065_c0_g1_i1:59-787(-)